MVIALMADPVYSEDEFDQGDATYGDDDFDDVDDEVASAFDSAFEGCDSAVAAPGMLPFSQAAMLCVFSLKLHWRVFCSSAYWACVYSLSGR